MDHETEGSQGMRALCADHCSFVLQLNNQEVQQACCRAFRSDPVFADFVERAPHLVRSSTDGLSGVLWHSMLSHPPSALCAQMLAPALPWTPLVHKV